MTFWGRLFSKLDPLKEPLAALEERMSIAEGELVMQREGLAREITERERVQAEIQRSIVIATRDVWQRHQHRRR